MATIDINNPEKMLESLRRIQKKLIWASVDDGNTAEVAKDCRDDAENLQEVIDQLSDKLQKPYFRIYIKDANGGRWVRLSK